MRKTCPLTIYFVKKLLEVSNFDDIKKKKKMKLIGRRHVVLKICEGPGIPVATGGYEQQTS